MVFPSRGEAILAPGEEKAPEENAPGASRVERGKRYGVAQFPLRASTKYQ